MRGKITLLIMLLALAATAVAAEPRLSNLDVHTTPTTYGDVLHVSYTLSDDKPLGRIVTHTYLPGAVDHKTVETRAYRYNYQDAFLLPRGYSGEQAGFVRIETDQNAPIRQNFIVQPQGTPTQQPSTSQTRTTTTIPQDVREAMQGQSLAIIINPEVPNVGQGDWVYWPITLVNNENRPIDVTLGVQGVRGWGTYRIDPQPTITVQPGQEYEAYMYISIDENAWTGLRSFWITAEYQGAYQEREVALAVLKPVDTRTTIPWWVWGGILGLIIIALLITILVLVMRKNNNQEEEDDFITYY